MKYDAIIIGAGHNGLTTAALLAKSGRKVLVLESREDAGGLAASDEFHSGYSSSGLFLDTRGLRPEVVTDLNLKRHGLEFLDEPQRILLPETDGPGIWLSNDAERFAQDNPKLEDAAAFHKYRDFLDRIGGFIRTIFDGTPPPITDRGTRGLWRLLRAGLSLQRLGQADMLEVLRVGPMCAGDFLNEYFKSQLLKAGLAAPGIHGTWMGPWSAGSTATLLIHEAFSGRDVRGGGSAVASALIKAAREAGAEIRVGSPVQRIRISKGAVHGVALANGENADAPIVASACDPKRTFFDLIDPVDLPLAIEGQIRVLKTRGTTAKMSIALNGPLEFSCRPGEPVAAARIGESLDDLEKAFDAVKYGRFSDRAALEIRVPTVHAPSLAPEGHHVVDILIHFAPYALKTGWGDAERASLAEKTLSRLAEYVPTLRERIVAHSLMTPADLEKKYSLTHGHIHHGEHSLDQLYSMRPSVDTAQYSTPLKGLFLCGSGSHPGGGLTGAPGYLAAKEIIKQT